MTSNHDLRVLASAPSPEAALASPPDVAGLPDELAAAVRLGWPLLAELYPRPRRQPGDVGLIVRAGGRTLACWRPRDSVLEDLRELQAEAPLALLRTPAGPHTLTIVAIAPSGGVVYQYEDNAAPGWVAPGGAA